MLQRAFTPRALALMLIIGLRVCVFIVLAAQTIANIVKSSLGPVGLDKVSSPSPAYSPYVGSPGLTRHAIVSVMVR